MNPKKRTAKRRKATPAQARNAERRAVIAMLERLDESMAKIATMITPAPEPRTEPTGLRLSDAPKWLPPYAHYNSEGVEAIFDFAQMFRGAVNVNRIPAGDGTYKLIIFYREFEEDAKEVTGPQAEHAWKWYERFVALDLWHGRYDQQPAEVGPLESQPDQPAGA